jgi:hypothetical protein
MSFPLFRRVSVSGCVALASVVALSASLSARQAPAAPQYDVTFDVQGSAYNGSTTFVIDKAGKVTGTMKLDTPATVDAKLNGEVKDGVWTFSYAFTMDNQGQPCSGTVSGSAKVTADHSGAEGTVTIGGDCSPDALSGTFAFKKRAK